MNVVHIVIYGYNVLCVTILVVVVRPVFTTYPLSLVPLGKIFSTPPSNMQRMAFLMYPWPWIDGASDRANKSNTFFLLTNFLQLEMSSRVSLSIASLLSWVIFVAITMVLKSQSTFITEQRPHHNQEPLKIVNYDKSKQHFCNMYFIRASTKVPESTRCKTSIFIGHTAKISYYLNTISWLAQIN